MVERKESHLARAAWLFVDESRLWVWIVLFFAMIFLFGLLFAVLSPLGHGMDDAGGGGDSRFDLGRGLYFSVVTVSSLGYGDVHPQGAGKVLAGIEVLLGLGMMGIMIAKLTSKRVSHFVSRLFVSETKRQLQGFEVRFDSCRSELGRVLEQVSRAYQQTPRRTPENAIDRPAIERALGSALEGLTAASRELHEYFQTEGSDRSYFLLAPAASLLRLAEAVEKAFFYLGQNVVNLPWRSTPSVLEDVLTYANRRRMDSALKTQQFICGLVVDGRKVDGSVREAFERVASLCTRIDGMLMPISEQPDQLVESS